MLENLGLGKNFRFDGMPIYSSELVPEKTQVQVRFPRTKKKRIRRKWSKDKANYEWQSCLWFIPGSALLATGYYCNPRSYGMVRNFIKEK